MHSDDRFATFDRDDPKNPINLSRTRKLHIVLATNLFTFNGALGSSIASGSQSEIAASFGVSSKTQLVLLTSLYLIGFVIGPLIFGPLSEHSGRRPVLIGTYIGYLAFTLGCALAPTYQALLVFRFLCGTCAIAPIIISPGLYADIYDNPEARGTAMACFMSMTGIGPEVAPAISGYVTLVSWRWTFWIALIMAGVGMPPLLLLPETYAPVLLRRQGKKVRLSSGVSDQNEKPSQQTMQKFAMVFTRPFAMFVQEPIVLFTALYMALVYSLLYLFFQAYPVVFQGLYGMSPGDSGLAFLPMVVGTAIAFTIFLWYTSYHRKALAQKKTWADQEEYRRLPLACGAAPAIVISLFWLGWTSYEFIHPIVPMLAGVFFGAGYLLVFLALSNYITDAYKQNAASAQAAVGAARSLTGVCLPLATGPMYGNLGVHWASSLLGFIALAMAVIPFVFIRYGVWIREHSRFCKMAIEQEKRTNRQPREEA